MYRTRPTRKSPKMKSNKSARFSTHEIARRFTKSFLDILILQLIKTEPAWGYDIIKKTETLYQVKLRHGALYPMLNNLETKGLVKSRRELQQGRARKVYEITKSGTELLRAYNDFTEAFATQKALDDSTETTS
jgi:PadR family transcriptional regulator PadR